jgi:hypothetical protein
MELHTGKMNYLTRLEILLSVAVPALCSGGAALGILLWQGNCFVDPGFLYGGSLAGAVAVLLACLAWIKPRRVIVLLLAPLYAVLIFLLPFGNIPMVLLQLLFGAGLAILVMRLNLLFSTPLGKKIRRESYGKVPV